MDKDTHKMVFSVGVTEAYYDDIQWKERSVCEVITLDINNPWVVGNVSDGHGGHVHWDCSGIVTDRLCHSSINLIKRNDAFNKAYLEPGDACDYEEGAFRGADTCFVPAPAAAPTAAPTAERSGAPDTRGYGTVATAVAALVGLLCRGTGAPGAVSCNVSFDSSSYFHGAPRPPVVSSWGNFRRRRFW